MYTLREASPATVLMSEDERDRVREQLDRILDTPLFKNSRRYPALLRFLVEETLAGRGDLLRERLLGVHVFDRPADYDTAVDPVVRVTAAEIRKRIAQYYHDEEHDAEIRIELLPGRYAPEFRFRTPRKEVTPEWPSPPEPFSNLAVSISPVAAAIPVPSPSPAGVDSQRSTYRRWFSVAGLCFALALATASLFRWSRPSATDQLFAPLLGSSRPILFCIPTDVGKKRGPAEMNPAVDPSSVSVAAKGSGAGAPSFLAFETLGENVVYSDMLATLSVARVLAIRHHDYRVKLNVATNLEDLQQQPAVMIGGLDNQWTMRALAPLRFHFAGSDEDRYWVADRDNPARKDMSLDLKLQYVSVIRDYAIIARLHNQETGQPEIILAGIGMSGTAAAGEFLGDERRVEELRKRIGQRFEDHDFEVVLSADVVNGIAGSPTIVSVVVM